MRRVEEGIRGGGEGKGEEGCIYVFIECIYVMSSAFLLIVPWWLNTCMFLQGKVLSLLPIDVSFWSENKWRRYRKMKTVERQVSWDLLDESNG